MAKKQEPGNFQDDAEVKEYDKGERAGKQSKPGGRNGRRGRGSGSRRNPGSKPSGQGPIVTRAKRDNDPGWYSISDRIVKDVASLTVNIQNGIPLDMGYNKPGTETGAAPEYIDGQEMEQSMPGIMTFQFIPTFGTNDDATSPLNMAANALYSYTVKDQLGYTKASACDFMIYNLAMDSAYFMYSWACRLYGILNYGYSATDMYTPRALIEAQFVDYDDLVANQPQFRAALNEFAFNLQALKVPQGMSYNTRHIWMCQNIYTDSPTTRAQYYLYMPRGFYQYSETNMTAQGPFTNNLQFVDWFGNFLDEHFNQSTGALQLIKVHDIITMLRSIIAPIWGSQDCKRMSSQILKAFGDQTVPVNPIDSKYIVTPSYSQEVLMQIENMYIYSNTPFANYRYGDADQYTIWEASLSQHVNDLDVGEYLVSTLKGAWSTSNMVETRSLEDVSQFRYIANWLKAFYNPTKIILNYHKDAITLNDVLVSTRLARSGIEVFNWNEQQYGTRELHFNIKGSGSEIISNAFITYFVNNYKTMNGVTTRTLSLQRKNFNSFNTFNDNAQSAGTQLLSLAEKFDWHPILGFWGWSRRVTETDFNSKKILATPTYHFDLDTITVTSPEQVIRINNAALLKMFQPEGLAGYGIRA